MAPDHINTVIKTHYHTLQVGADARAETIDLSYRRLAKKYHPDYNSSLSAISEMQALNEAYSVLKDPRKRRAYDFEVALRSTRPVSRFGDRYQNGAFVICLLLLGLLFFQFANPPRPSIAGSSLLITTAFSNQAESGGAMLSDGASESALTDEHASDPTTLPLQKEAAQATVSNGDASVTESTDHKETAQATVSNVDASVTESTDHKVSTVGDVSDLVASSVMKAEGDDLLSNNVIVSNGTSNINVASTSETSELGLAPLDAESSTRESKEQPANHQVVTSTVQVVISSTVISTSAQAPSTTPAQAPSTTPAQVPPLTPTQIPVLQPTTQPAVAQPVEIQPTVVQPVYQPTVVQPVYQPAIVQPPVVQPPVVQPPVVQPPVVQPPVVQPPVVQPPVVQPPVVQPPVVQPPVVQAVVQPAPLQAAAPQPQNLQGTFRLLNPSDGTNGRKRQTFEWSTDIVLAPKQGFELVFWRPKQDPMVSGFGLAAPTTGSSLTVNLDKLDITLGSLLDWGHYRWGILLVETEPYNRIALLGTNGVPETRAFLFTNYKSAKDQSTAAQSSP